MPTRFVVNDLDLPEFKEEALKSKKELRKKVRATFTKSYTNLPNPKENDKAGHTKFFFTRLRFWSISLFKSIIFYYHSQIMHQSIYISSASKQLIPY